MKLSEIQGQYTVVENPKKLSELGGNYTVVNPGLSGSNDSSAALSNATALNTDHAEKKGAYEKVTGVLKSIFPGSQLGEDLTLSAEAIGSGIQGLYHMATGNKDKAQLNFNNFHSLAQAINPNKDFGDAVKTFATIGGLVESLPASTLGKAAQFAKYGALGGAGQAAVEGKDTKGVVTSAAKEGAIGAATGGAVGLLGKAFKGIAAPFKAAFNKPAAQAFESEGIKAPLSAISKSNFVKKGEALLSKGAFGKEIIDQVNLATEQLDKKVTDLVEATRPDKIISSENLGKTIQQGLKEFEDNFKLTEGKVYDEFSKTYGKSNTYAKDTASTLATILKEQGKDFFKGEDNRLVRMFDAITGISEKDIKGGNFQAIEDKLRMPKNLSFDELKSTRSSVGQQLQKEPENTALKRLYGALSNDMQTAVRKVGEQSPLDGEAKAATDALDKLNEGYRTGKAKIESNIAQSIGMSNPEQIAKNLVKRNSADTLKTVKEMIGEDRFKEVSNTWLRDQFDASMTRGKFDIAKFEKNLKAFDKETIDQILTTDQQKDLKDAVSLFNKYQGMSDLLKSGQKFASGSQTAFLNSLNSMGTRAAAAGSALISGNPKLAFILALETGAEYGLTKLFTTELGRKILTEGINPSNTGLLKQAGYSVAQIAKIKGGMSSSDETATTSEE